LAGVIAKGMAKDPTDRYQSAMDLAHAARAAMDAPTNPNVPWVPEQTATQMAPTTPIVPRVPVANPSVTWPHSSATQAAPLISATPVSPPSYGQPPTGPAPTNNRRKWIIGGAAAAVLVVAIAAVIAIVGSRPDTSSTSATASSEATPSAAAEEVTSTEPTADPWPASDTGTKETIADYVAKNGITETAVKQGDPGAPKIDLPVPPGWKPAGAQTPEWAYSAIMYTGAESAKYQPTIIALMSKLTGNVDPKKILSLAPGELQNLPGWKGTNSGTASSLDGNDAFQAGGTWVDKGVTKAVAQKTVVIPRSDGLYVLQLNVDGLPSQQNILDTATTAIDDQTKIT
jgi:hypothetical protein